MERLDKMLAANGNISRKEAKTLIKSEKVLVNGAPAVSAEQKIDAADIVTLDGKIIDSEKHVYYMMNKPAGVLCATFDPDCETVLDLLPEELRRKGLFPAGRLDKDTEGFVLITDDGDFAHKILSPKSHVAKTYFARLDAQLPDNLPQAFAAGLDIGGALCSPAQLEIITGGNNPEVRLVIYEGMYHQVKRMFAKFSLNVIYLKRLAIGGLWLDENLPSGSTRKIIHKELALMYPIFGDNLRHKSGK